MKRILFVILFPVALSVSWEDHQVFATARGVCFAQNVSTNVAQEALDFMRSPQGTGVTHKVQVLMFASRGKTGISNELVRVSNDNTISLPVRQSATEALQTYDRSATNSYQEIETFIQTLPFAGEPPMTTDTIAVMKRSLEIGSSATVQLQAVLTDTNIPAFYREKLSQAVTNILHNIGN